MKHAQPHSWDIIGVSLSALCVVHCLAMPLVIAYLPHFGLNWLSSDGFHLWFAIAAVIFGSGSFLPSYLQHRRMVVPALGAIGLVVLSYSAVAGNDLCCAAACCETSSPIRSESTVTSGLASFGWTPIGGVLLMLAHGLNCRFACHCCRAVNK